MFGPKLKNSCYIYPRSLSANIQTTLLFRTVNVLTIVLILKTLFSSLTALHQSYRFILPDSLIYPFFRPQVPKRSSARSWNHRGKCAIKLVPISSEFSCWQNLHCSKCSKYSRTIFGLCCRRNPMKFKQSNRFS